jgi:ElaB/YqjD/DUF883 family membrane-anchored ribosome-binding protein
MFDNVTSRRQERKAARILNERPLRVANEELRILLSTAQDLVDRLETAADPELKRLRKQAEPALARARAAIGEGRAQLGEQAQRLAEHGQRYVRRRSSPFLMAESGRKDGRSARHPREREQSVAVGQQVSTQSLSSYDFADPAAHQ